MVDTINIFLFWIYPRYVTVLLPKDILHKFSSSNYAGMVGNWVTPCRPVRTSNDQSARGFDDSEMFFPLLVTISPSTGWTSEARNLPSQEAVFLTLLLPILQMMASFTNGLRRRRIIPIKPEHGIP